MSHTFVPSTYLKDFNELELIIATENSQLDLKQSAQSTTQANFVYHDL